MTDPDSGPGDPDTGSDDPDSGGADPGSGDGDPDRDSEDSDPGSEGTDPDSGDGDPGSGFPVAFSDRVGRVEPSATVAVSNRAGELEGDGVDVVDMSVGEPDFPTPERIREAGTAAIEAGHTTYTASKGVPELRAAVAEDLADRGADYDPGDVTVTPGGKHAIFEAVHALVDEGDEVVLLDPAWVSYPAIVALAGGETVRVDTAPDFRLETSLAALREAVTDGTALLVVNTPNNPTGAVYSRAALEAVRDLAVEHDVAVLSDEIYASITYGREHVSLASLDGMGDRTAVVDGFSKAYAMTGWRLGYLAAPPELAGAAGKVQSHSVTCAANFVQRAGITALREVEEPVEEMVAAFRERRDLFVDLLADHGVDIPTPEGAFYLMVPVADDDHEWAMEALEEAGVASVPGTAFGADGFARFSYAAGADRIREGVDRLAGADLI